jgi:hypothetical protein
VAAESPGWCKHCGEPVEQASRPQGRPREFCVGGRCRQAFGRKVRLRRALAVEVGLSHAQVDRLLAVFQVSRRPAAKASERDARASRADQTPDRSDPAGGALEEDL